MKLLAFESLVGGAGATTLTANLAAALQRHGEQVAVLDLCAQNHLAAHFAQQLAEPRGLFDDQGLVASVLDNSFRAASEVIVVPFGVPKRQPTASQCVEAFDKTLTALTTLQSVSVTYLLVNLPTGHSFQDSCYLPKDTPCMLVFEPEPRSYIALQRWHYAHKASPIMRYRGLINKVAPHMELQRDSYDLMRAELSDGWLLPYSINRDQHVPEALATQQLIYEYTLGAQANADIQEVAFWLTTQSEQLA